MRFGKEKSRRERIPESRVALEKAHAKKLRAARPRRRFRPIAKQCMLCHAIMP
jgi:hypothetical protein